MYVYKYISLQNGLWQTLEDYNVLIHSEHKQLINRQLAALDNSITLCFRDGYNLY